MITSNNTNLSAVYPFESRVFTEFNRFVNDALASTVEAPKQEEIYEDIESISNDEDGWKVRLEFPGYKKEELKISLEDHFLNIEASPSDDARSFLSEEHRRIKVSKDVDVDNIIARLEDGILYLEIPRRVKPEPKVITVQ